MRKLDVLAGALLIVGGLNWGLVALAEFDLVAWLVRRGLRRDERGQPDRLRAGRRRRDLRHRRGRRPPVGRRSARRQPPRAVSQTSIRSRDATDPNHPRGLCGDGRDSSPALDRRAPLQTLSRRRDKNIVQTAVAAGKFETLVSLAQASRAREDAVGQGPVHRLRTDRRGLREGAEGHARAARPRQGGAALGAPATTSPRAG